MGRRCLGVPMRVDFPPARIRGVKDILCGLFRVQRVVRLTSLNGIKLFKSPLAYRSLQSQCKVNPVTLKHQHRTDDVTEPWA